MNNPRAFPDQEGSGMTLRDYFAAAAMAAYLTRTTLPLTTPFEAVARDSFGMADAMLEGRQK